MKILIVDDHPGMRELMRSYLPNSFDEIHECEDGSDAVDSYGEHLPDWVLMDWKMKRMNGLVAAQNIIARFPDAKILMVTNYEEKDLRRAAAEAGLCGYVLKDDLQMLRSFFNESEARLAANAER
jgi:two-component system response regulator DegU